MFFIFLIQILTSKKMFSMGSFEKQSKKKDKSESTKTKMKMPTVYCTGEGKGYPLQDSCLEDSMNRGAWRATVHGVAKSWTRVND